MLEARSLTKRYGLHRGGSRLELRRAAGRGRRPSRAERNRASRPTGQHARRPAAAEPRRNPVARPLDPRRSGGLQAPLGLRPRGSSSLYHYLSGREYLELIGDLARDSDRSRSTAVSAPCSTCSAWARTAAPACPLTPRACGRKILIAAALLDDPELLVFDEPLSGLDVTLLVGLSRRGAATRGSRQDDRLQLARARYGREDLPSRDHSCDAARPPLRTRSAPCAS